eukprot:46778-Amorphochlora_amoeboformis.AAC.1
MRWDSGTPKGRRGQANGVRNSGCALDVNNSVCPGIMGLGAEICKSILHPGEIVSMFKLKYGGYLPKTMASRKIPIARMAGRDFCYAMLNRVRYAYILHPSLHHLRLPDFRIILRIFPKAPYPPLSTLLSCNARPCSLEK